MTVGIEVGSIVDEIGSSDFFHAFFSTVSVRLEPEWGGRFPNLMRHLYDGEIRQEAAADALAELSVIRAELAKFKPDQVVWDANDRSKVPPWGSKISPTITDLSNYFVTSTGRDLIATLAEALEALRDDGGVGRIVSY